MTQERILSPGTRNVLIVGSRHVGNNIFCTPAIHFLRRTRPDLVIDVVSMSERGVDTFRNNPDISNLHHAHTRAQLRRLARNHDVVLGMYKGEARRALTGLFRVPYIAIPPGSTMHRAEQRLQWVSTLAGGTIMAEDRAYVLRWTADDEALIHDALGPTSDRDLPVGLHLGCGRTAIHGWKFWSSSRNQANKLWPLDRYIELARAMKRVMPNVRFVITGSDNERFLGRRFVEELPDSINLIGKTSIGSVAALMAHLRVFITHDTGVLHVACSTTVPIIGLFGPTKVAATGPYPPSERHTIIRRKSMLEITAQEVCEAAMQILSGVKPLVPDGDRVDPGPLKPAA